MRRSIRPVRALPGRFHDFGQHALHIFGMDEKDRRAVGTDARGAKHTLAHRLELSARLGDIGHLETDMVLPAQRVLGEEPVDRGSGVKRLRSEEHTSELQSLMRISYAVFCLKKKKN